MAVASREPRVPFSQILVLADLLAVAIGVMQTQGLEWPLRCFESVSALLLALLKSLELHGLLD